MANWAELNQDILILIAKRVHFLEDFSAFRRVCRSWRSVAVKKNFKGSQQFPWLMLAEEYSSDYRGFACATEGNLIGSLMLPEAKGKRCFESLGWLITLAVTGDMNLLDPVSRVQIPLPHVSTFKYYEKTHFSSISKAVLSSRPCVSSKDTNYVLMVLYESSDFLGFWRPGDKVWTTVETPPGPFSDITYYNGKFYVVNSVGYILVCDVGGRDPIVVAHRREEILFENFKFKRLYIVESNGELLVVVRNMYDTDYSGDYISEVLDKDEEVDEFKISYWTMGFEVFKVDLSNWDWVELQSLGDNALFVGDNASISVKASKFQGIRPSCIYFTDDFSQGYVWFKRGGGEDMGIYNMEDRSVSFYYKVKSFGRICPPLWVRPYF